MRKASTLAGLCILLATAASAFSPEGYEEPRTEETRGPDGLTDRERAAIRDVPAALAPRTDAGLRQRDARTPPVRRTAPQGGAAPSLTDARGQRITPVGQAPPVTAPPAAAPSGADASPGAGPSPGPGGAETPPPSAAAPRVGAGATRRIGSKLENMKGALGGLSDAGAFPGGAGPGKPAADGAKTPAPPSAPQDLLPAAVAAGYDATLRDMGLRRGAGPDGRPALFDRAGRPAGPEALEALAKRLPSEPRGAASRSDFYDKLPRRGYEGLLSDFAASGAARPAYKDIGLNGPDFAWTRSCDRVSGDCNPHAAERSYRRNEDVSAETLANVWKSVKEQPADDGWDAYVKEQKKAYGESRARQDQARGIGEKLRRSIFKPGSPLAGLLDSLARAAGFKPVWGAAGSDGVAAGYAGAEDAGPAGAGRERGLVTRDPGRPGASGTPESAPASRPWGRLLLGLLGAVAAGAALRLFLSREELRVRLPPLFRRGERDQ